MIIEHFTHPDEVVISDDINLDLDMINEICNTVRTINANLLKKMKPLFPTAVAGLVIKRGDNGVRKIRAEIERMNGYTSSIVFSHDLKTNIINVSVEILKDHENKRNNLSLEPYLAAKNFKKPKKSIFHQGEHLITIPLNEFDSDKLINLDDRIYDFLLKKLKSESKRI